MSPISNQELSANHKRELFRLLKIKIDSTGLELLDQIEEARAVMSQEDVAHVEAKIKNLQNARTENDQKS